MARAHRIRHSRLVRRRTSTVILAAGAILVLGLLVGLFELTRSPSQAATPVRPSVPESAPVASAPAAEPEAEHPSSRSVSAARERASVTPAPRARLAAASRAPEPAPAPAAPAPDTELKRDENGKLVPIFPIAELRWQGLNGATDAGVKACIERSGQRPTGKATLNFVVAARDKKLVIDSTGVQDEETLADYPALLECMHKTASAFVLDINRFPIPELGTPIYVRRHVRLENGELAENSVFNFSYHH